MSRPEEWEILDAVRLLRGRGYIVRRPGEATLETTLEVDRVPIDHHARMGHIGLRLDTTLNGTPYALAHHFPFELVLSEDDDFRRRYVPKFFADKLAHYMADRMVPGIEEQVKVKLDPLVPEKRMSLVEIEAYIEYALSECKP